MPLTPPLRTALPLWSPRDVPRPGRQRLLHTGAELATGGDALQWFYTGASADGGTQSDVHASLGGYRSRLRLESLGILASGGPGGLRYEHASAENGAGSGVLTAYSDGTAAWQPPGATAGDAVAVPPGPAVVVPGADPEKFVIVRRVNDDDLGDAAALTLVEQLNNWYEDADTAEGVAGSTLCRGYAMRNASSETLTDGRLWLATLGELAAVDASGYAASGAVAVGGAGTDPFADWPDGGLVSNDDSGEALYYTERTDAELTVPAAGRDVWSDVAGGALGTAADVLRPIPSLRIGLEAPDAQPAGQFSLLAADTDACPVTAYRPTAAGHADCLLIPPLPPGHIHALWAERAVAAGAAPGLPFVLHHLQGRFEGA